MYAVGGLNGTIQGPVAAPGQVDDGLQLDGQDDSVEFTEFSAPMQGTFELWMNAGEGEVRGRFLGSVDEYEAYVENRLIANH